jgi:S-methylmethionine-dependent homocysteine/selenocysteine methylase
VLTLQQRLDNNEVILIDGATGTELQRRGVPMDGLAWSATANLTHPDIVRSVHEDYIRAGADIIITNTFGTARHVLEPAGVGDKFREINLRAVELAKEARDRASGGRPVYIAGSLSTFFAGASMQRRPITEQAAANYRELADTLAEAGVDLIMTEMMQDTTHAPAAVSAAVATGLPAWVGISVEAADDGSVILARSHEPLSVGLDALLPLGGAAVTIMHSFPDVTRPALKMVRERWPGPVGAYAHMGEFTMPLWHWVNMLSPEEYAAEAAGWVEMGVQAVGGCCGLGPEYIRVLKERMPSRVAARGRE